MLRTPLQTLLAERLQSARGLGWEIPTTEMPATAGAVRATRQKSGDVPAWFRLAVPMLRRLGFARG